MKSYLNNLGEFNEEEFKKIEDEKKTACLDEYEAKSKQEGYTEDISFSVVDNKGNLIAYKDDVRLIMRNKDIYSGKGTNLIHRAKLIGKTYTVNISKVDRNSNTVYVSARGVYADMRAELNKDIDKAFKTREPFYVAGKVLSIEDENSYLVVDMFGVGVLGIIPRGEWSASFVGSFEDVGVKVGDVVQCRLLLQSTRLPKYGNRIAYVLSREQACKNPYDGLEKRYPVGTIVVIKAIQLRERNFFGTIDGLDGVDVYCSYPADRHFGDKAVDLTIKLGHYYAAYVRTVDEKTRRFRAKVFTETTLNGKKCADVTEEQIKRSVALEMRDPHDFAHRTEEEIKAEQQEIAVEFAQKAKAEE